MSESFIGKRVFSKTLGTYYHWTIVERNHMFPDYFDVEDRAKYATSMILIKYYIEQQEEEHRDKKPKIIRSEKLSKSV